MAVKLKPDGLLLLSMASLAFRDGDTGTCERLAEEAIEAMLRFTHTIAAECPNVENLAEVRAGGGMG